MQISMHNNRLVVSLSPRLPQRVLLSELHDYIDRVIREPRPSSVSVMDVWKASSVQVPEMEMQLLGVNVMLVHKDRQFPLPTRWLVSCAPDEEFGVIVVPGKQVMIVSLRDERWNNPRTCLSVGRCKVCEE